MLVSRHNPTRIVRSAFTLLEVLVVVAILVVLASVASIAVFNYLDEAKENKATFDMQALENAYKSVVLQNGGEVDSSNFNIEMLVPKLTQGQASLQDPWGQPYQYRFTVQGDTNEERIQFYTRNPKTNNEIVWPRK